MTYELNSSIDNMLTFLAQAFDKGVWTPTGFLLAGNFQPALAQAREGDFSGWEVLYHDFASLLKPEIWYNKDPLEFVKAEVELIKQLAPIHSEWTYVMLLAEMPYRERAVRSYLEQARLRNEITGIKVYDV